MPTVAGWVRGVAASRAHGCRLSAWGRSLSCPRLQVRAAVLRSGAMSAKVQASQAREPQVAAAARQSRMDVVSFGAADGSLPASFDFGAQPQPSYGGVPAGEYAGPVYRQMSMPDAEAPSPPPVYRRLVMPDVAAPPHAPPPQMSRLAKQHAFRSSKDDDAAAATARGQTSPFVKSLSGGGGAV